MIQLVIELSENDYELACKYPDALTAVYAHAIKNGTPLPTGHWKRMSDLPIEQDDRWECSKCGNVIHVKNKMDLRTFHNWDGRCGAKMEVEE